MTTQKIAIIQQTQWIQRFFLLTTVKDGIITEIKEKGKKRYGFLITKREIHLQTGKDESKSGKFAYKMGLSDYK